MPISTPFAYQENLEDVNFHDVHLYGLGFVHIDGGFLCHELEEEETDNNASKREQMSLSKLLVPTKKTWRMFPFTMLITMISALFTLMVDSYAMSWQKKRLMKTQANLVVETLENGSKELEKESGNIVTDDAKSQLVRYQVIAQMRKFILQIGTDR